MISSGFDKICITFIKVQDVCSSARMKVSMFVQIWGAQTNIHRPAGQIVAAEAPAARERRPDRTCELRG